jgi:hypothetical protein
MRHRYVLLAAGTLALAAILAVWGHPSRRAGDRRAPEPPPAAAPIAMLSIDVRGGTVTPEHASVPKDSRVRLTVLNRDSTPVRFTLAGYEDRVHADSLPAGRPWTTEFLADRPGEDFTWLVDGEPAGRLAVAGSHLVEGHR